MRPGVNVEGRESGAPRTVPTNTGKAFAGLVTERGRTDVAFKITSWAQFLRECGERFSWNAMYWDAVQAFFIFGGRELWVSRIYGAAAVRAFVNIPDAAAAVSLIARAVGVGDWYNSLNVIVEVDPGDATARRVRVTHDTDTDVSETSPYYTTQAELRDWSENSAYIRLEIGGSALVPAVTAGLNLATGADDRASINDAARTAALNKFDIEWGPGNVVIPGLTTSAGWQVVLDFAFENNRSALLDYPDTADEATLVTLADTVRGLGEVGLGVAGWLRMTHTGTTSKLVPPALAVAAKIAVHDAETDGWGQNKPVAGIRRGTFPRALGVSQVWPDKDQRTRLNEAGVNLVRERRGIPTLYGWRSLADPESNAGAVNFGHRRLYTALSAKIDDLLEEFVFEEIDGERVLLGKVNGAVKGRVVDRYYKMGSLYGASAEEAYSVKTDDPVNTAETIQNRELHVDVTVVESEFAEEINVIIVKNLITEGAN